MVSVELPSAPYTIIRAYIRQPRTGDVATKHLLLRPHNDGSPMGWYSIGGGAAIAEGTLERITSFDVLAVPA